MTTREALGRLVKGVHADLGDYRVLRELLDAQFEAALQHRSAVISHVAKRISEVTAQLETRRVERVALARVLLDRQTKVSIAAVVERLPTSARPAFSEWWKALEAMVRECQQLNRRNCNLLVNQHEILQRVLQVGTGGTYAPA